MLLCSCSALRMLGVKKGQIYVDRYDPDAACNGTTIFADLHEKDMPRILEVDMQGTIVWQYVIPETLQQYTQPGLDVDVLEDGNILFVLPMKGIYEVNRAGEIVWFHADDRVAYDADRLPSGNTIYVRGNRDDFSDAQVREIAPDGETVWQWQARDFYYDYPYASIEEQGWTQTNAVTRLSSGNTLINLRNFNLTVEVTPQGEPVWSYVWTTLDGFNPYDPEIIPPDNLLICLQGDAPYQAVEINRISLQVVWGYQHRRLRSVRDCDRLPNGNTLLVGVLKGSESSVILEITPEGRIVWQLKVKGFPARETHGWFYNADRICSEEQP
jgi:hypothetical protein